MKTLYITPYSDLNQVLVSLINEIALLLKSNLIGVYLQGSFAVGDFHLDSDVDILVVIEEDIDNQSIVIFQKLHKSLFKTLKKPWGQRIELSYAPLQMLKRKTKKIDPKDFPRDNSWKDPGTGMPAKTYPFWYLDNGADHLKRSEHDNTQVVRWVTREKGRVLGR